MMDYLRFMITLLHTYRPIVPLLAEGLRRTGQTHLLELGAGAGGGTEDVYQALRQQPGLADVRITLTDLYPPARCLGRHRPPHPRRHPGRPRAGRCAGCAGVKSRFFGPIFLGLSTTSRPRQPRQCYATPCRPARGIAVLEGAGKHWLEIGLAWTVLPVAQLLLTPFFRPFRLSRLVFTYLLPLIPLGTIFDGTVSILRLYPPDYLLRLAHLADPAGHYQWQAGKKRHWWGPEVTYLIGWPRVNE